MKRKLSNVSSKYGAPMGRHTGPTISYGGKVNLQRVHIDRGGYDSGGAYWGLGAPLYWCCNEDGEEGFIRARDRSDAKRQILALVPDAKFYR